MSKKLLNLCLAALLSVVSTAAWALSEVNGVYQIGTAEDLKAFADLVNGGEGMPYLNAVLTADINKGADETMIGRDGLDYQGCFDGAGYTITIDVINQDADGTAIFRNVGDNALIKNLKVQGTITTNKKYASGIAAWSSGTIRGCYVDVNVVSAMAGDATHGGVVGIAYQGAMIENCLAKFTINGATTQNSGGVVGWCDGRTNVINCLVINDGSNFDSASGSGTIGRNDGNLQTVNLSEYIGNEYDNRPGGASTNNYATNAWGNTKCVTIVPYDDLADGRICYQLNTDQSNIAWVQQIGTDPFPVPAAFGSAQVYASGPTDCDGKSEGELTFSNEGTAQATAHAYDKFGICQKCGCYNFYALERDATDGYYLIRTPEDIDLAEGWNRITNGARFSIKLANDLEYTAEPGRYIFNASNWFDGCFNGDGHQLTIAMTEMTGNNASLFPKFAGRRFENVIMHGTIETSGQYAGSIAGQTYRDRVNIINTFSDIDINTTHAGDNTTGGLIGIVESKTQVMNTIYAGNINGNEEITECLAGFCGWSSAQTYYTNCAFLGTLNGAIGDSKTLSRNPSNITCTNVYYANEYGYEDEAKATLIEDATDIENGALAYALNGNEGGVERFYQKIGEDLFPVPIKKEGALVYATASEYRCDGQPLGETVYTNTPSGSAVIPPHQFEDGFCTVCDAMQEDFMTPVDGWFEISNGAELVWWSNYAAKKDLGASARLTDDIDMDGYCDRWANVGTEGAPFYGNFDGQFHTISNLIVDHPADNGVGLIAVMNSLPSANYNGISDSDARAAEGVYIKNVVLDESCELIGRGYIGLVGMTAPWAGHVNIKGVMMCGDVTANGGPNASGVFGCVMSSTCHVTIDNCGMTGNVYGPKENGSFSGWLGSYAEVTNCFAVGSVEGIQDDDHYFARYSSATFTNCYSLYGTQVPTVSEEDFASGALAWRANGSQFRTSYWYQTIGDDLYPYPDPSHGTVIYAAGQYFSVANEEDLGEVAAAIQTFEEEDLEGTIATQELLDEYKALLDALIDAKTILEFADAIDAVNEKKVEVEKNAAIYQAYIDKCEDVKDKLANDDSFEGSLRESLEYYLSENDEPSDENPLGTYEYIKETHTATAEEIKAETERVTKWLADAIAEDYKAGTDVSGLIPNSDFSEGHNTKWTNGWATGNGTTIKDSNGKTIVGVEAWNVTGDMYQTVEGMKPGYYLVGTHAAFRPSNNRYSTNYAAGFYANDIFNYFPAVIEDPVTVDEAVDQVNCNLNGAGAHDLLITDDGAVYDNIEKAEEAGATALGYVVHGETGMAAAANADRYQAYTIAYVGEDGKLTVGIKNPGTKYSSDWTGWSALKVTYCGDDEDFINAALGTVLKNMMDRANTILEYEMSEETAAAGPNYPEALKAELDAAVGSYSSAQTIEAQAALVAKFSDIFQKIYAGKQAYIALYNAAEGTGSIEMGNLPLVEKDGETGEWYESGGNVFSEDELNALAKVSDEMFEAYYGGTYSTEEALEAASLDNPAIAEIAPDQDEDGYYILSNPKQYVAFRAIAYFLDTYAKGKLVNDIDMTGIGMQPGNDKDTRFHGILDGQGYALNNLYIAHYAQNTGIFGAIDGATVKNLKVTGEYYSDSKYIGGITGYTYGDCVIDNCDVAVKMYSTVDGDGTHGGLIGVNETAGTVVSNCLVNCPMFGESTNSCGGVIGWSTAASTVKNTLILTQSGTISSSSCNTVSRNPDNCTVSNVFYVLQLGDAKGTKVTDEQLASGEVAYKLNDSQSENVAWFQTIGTDVTPRLFEGATVYFYGGKYINEQPNPQLNAFAFNLEAKVVGSNVVVKFNLNAEAEAAEIRFFNGELMVYKEDVPAGELRAGAHSVTVDASKLPADPTTLNYEVAVTGKGSLDVLKMGESYNVYGPYGMAVNNNPASKGFGQVLLAESWVEDYGTKSYISSKKIGALFAFDADFQQINSADGTPGFYGGLDIANETPLEIIDGNKFDLKDLRFTEDGRLFVARASGTTNSSVWEINPENLDEPWKPVFTGGELDEATGITYVGNEEQNRMAVGFAFEGKGEDLKMYVLGGQRSNGERNTTDYNCAFYNLGTATKWTTAPSGYVAALDGVYTYTSSYAGIREDGRGGLWFIQNQHTAETPAIKHFDAEGNEDYSDISTATSGGRIAVTTDGNYLAIPMGSGKIVLYETNYVPMANGKIFLDPKLNISVSESSISSLAFDYANNLYVASGGTETFSRYTIPTENKLVITPGNGIGTGGILGDLNGDGKVDIADAVTVLNIMASSEYDAAADINNDQKVDIADFVSILNIMAAQ
ncbi:MAG: dockerin type I repeat-containing protein [Bacteroidaceae bacterium]|nr:dockerin type I repeat-containing protein [Bacteroidaceae bacterium]